MKKMLYLSLLFPFLAMASASPIDLDTDINIEGNKIHHNTRDSIGSNIHSPGFIPWETMNWALQNPLKTGAILAGTCYFAFSVGLVSPSPEMVATFGQYSSRIAHFFGDSTVNYVKEQTTTFMQSPMGERALKTLHRGLFNLGAAVFADIANQWRATSPAGKTSPSSEPMWERIKGSTIMTEALAWSAAQMIADNTGMASWFTNFEGLFQKS